MLLIAVALGLLLFLLQRDREALVGGVEVERLEQIEEVARLVSSDVVDVVDDLQLIARISGPSADTDVTRNILLAILAGVRAYSAAGVYEGGNEPASLIFAEDPRGDAGELAELVRPEMEKLAARVAPVPGDLAVSSILQVDDRSFRVFGLRDDDDLVVVMAVETSAWLAGIRLVSSDPQNRVLVRGPAGGFGPGSDEGLRQVLKRPNLPDEVTSLLGRMRDGERGTVRLSRRTSRELELGDAETVVAFAPIRLHDQEHWSVATFSSMGAMREQERGLLIRFGTAGGAILLLIAGFGGYVVVATRRYAVLRERLAHAAELAELNTRLIHSEKLATVGGLSAGIAHEIGTPLGVVRGRAEYALKKLEPEHAARKSIETVIEQIDRVSRIIRELLDFSRPRPASTRPTSLHDTVARTASLLQLEFDRAEMEVVVAVADDLPALAADGDQLQQVLVNLMMNAIDACEPGCRVEVEATRRGDEVVITVQDDGSGMEEDVLNQVFDPFFTTKKRGQGTGLGLSVVSQIVRSHGGEIDLESKPGRGTTVTLRWPISKKIGREEEV